MSKKKQPRQFTGLKIFLIILILALIAGAGLLAKMCFDLTNEDVPLHGSSTVIQLPTQDPGQEPSTEATEPPPPETTQPEPEPEHVVSTATLGAMGDLLMHMPIFDKQYNAECDNGDGTYNFDSVFEHVKSYTSAVDYAVANLETTLGGTDNGYPYHGYPNFNCPDEIVDGAKNAGFDMLLTANNHSYDTGIIGYKRTLETVRGKGLQTLGTMLDAEEPKWTIQEINGIQVGMLCYTYAVSETQDGRPSLNGMPTISEAGICNYFMPSNPAPMYADVEKYLEEMEQAGAEATVMYIHWGVEYITYPNDNQKAIAQKLCDLGIDVIIGGHPHVIEPVALLESTVDPQQKTVCIYSLGNAVSNQRTGGSQLFPNGYIEDGILFSVTFEKYSDGKVYLAGTDALPTWVNRFSNERGKREYNILPLDTETKDQWKELYGINDATFSAAEKSYDRTMGIVGEGLTQCQEYLAQQKTAREEYYYDLAYNPEKYATEANETTEVTETPTETAGD